MCSTSALFPDFINSDKVRITKDYNCCPIKFLKLKSGSAKYLICAIKNIIRYGIVPSLYQNTSCMYQNGT